MIKMEKLYLDNRDIHTLFSSLSSKLLRVYKSYPNIFVLDKKSNSLSGFLSYCFNLPSVDEKQLTKNKFVLVNNVINSQLKLKEFEQKTNLVCGKDFVVAVLHCDKELRNKKNLYC